jgi:hypothetical protein
MDSNNSYETVLDPDDINELISLRDSTTEAQFRVGDLACKYANRSRDFGVTKAFMYGAIGSYYGKQARTIRSYSYVAAFYPREVRERYPILSFDHFKVAMRAEDWEAVLEWAIGSLDGRPQTVDACIAEFAIKPSEPESLDNVLQPLRRYIVNLPGFIREKIERILEEIEEIIKEAVN